MDGFEIGYCQVEDCSEYADYECCCSGDHPQRSITIMEIVLNHPQFLCAKHHAMGAESGAWDELPEEEKQP